MRKLKVLALIDVQNDFITGALRNEEAIEAIPNIVNKVNEFDGDLIVLTKDTHFEDTYFQSREGQKLPILHCVKDTEGWEIEKNVREALNHNGREQLVIEKYTFGATNLAEEIEYFLSTNMGYKHDEDELEIEICGFCTDICVVSNATILKANFYDNADIKVIKNCCAGVTPETHDAALNTMKMCQIDVI